MAIFSKGFQRFLDEAEKKDSAAGMTPALSQSKELTLDEIIQEFGPKEINTQQRAMMNQSDATKRSNANAVRQGAQAIMDMDLLNINDQQLMQAYQNANAMNASMDAQLGMAAQDPRLPSYSPQLRAAQATLQQAQRGIGRSQGGVNAGWLNSGKSAAQIRNETYQARKSNIGNYSDYEQLMKDLNLDVNADLAADLYKAGKNTTMVRNPENVKQAISEATDEQLERMRQGEDPGFLNRLAYGVNSALGVKQKSSQQENYDAIVEEQKRRKDAAEAERIATWADIDAKYDAQNGTLWNMLTPEEQQEALSTMKDITPETMETWAADTLKEREKAEVYGPERMTESVQQFMDLTESGDLYKTYSDIYAQEAQQRRDDWIQVGKGDYTGTDPDMKKANDAINAANDRIEEIWDALLQFDLGDESPEKQALETELAELQNQLNGLYENVDAMAAGATEKLDTIRETLYGQGGLGRLVGASIMEGFGNFADRFYKSADFILGRPINAVGQLVTGNNKWQNPLTAWTNTYGQYADQLRLESDNAVQALGGGKGAETFSNALTGIVENIPNTLMAVMTGGAANAGGLGAAQAQAVQQLMEAGASRTIAQKIVTNAVTDPQYWLTFMQEVGSDYQEALKDGASEEAATVYAMVTALINSQIEIGVEGTSGIQGLGRDGEGGIWSKIVTAVSGKDLRMLAKILDSATDEGTEEFKQGLVSGLAAKAIYDHDGQWLSFTPGENAVFNAADVGNEMLQGAITGGLLGGITEPIMNGVYRSAADLESGSNIIGNNQAEALAGIAEDSAHIHNDITAGIKNGTLNLNTVKGQRAVGKLFRETYAALDEASKAALDDMVIQPVQRQLEANGYTGDAAKAAQTIAKEYHGGHLTKREFEIYDDPIVTQIATQLFEGEFGDEEGINIDESDVKRQQYQQGVQKDLNTLMKMPDLSKQDTESSDQEGAKAELQQPDTSKLGAVNAKEETVPDQIDQNGVVADDETGVETAELYGRSGRSQGELIRNLKTAGIEFNDEIAKAYTKGETRRRNDVNVRLQHIRELNQGGKNGTRQGVVRSISAEEAEQFNVKRMNGKLSKKQYAAVQALRKVAGRMNLNIVLYESQVNENGQRTGSNGFYDSASDTVYLDMFAGYGNEQAILRTASHELTHVIQKWSPEQYRQMQDFLIQTYYSAGENTLRDLIQDQMDKAKQNGHALDEVGAMDEVTADAMEMMLGDADAIRALAQKDEGLFTKIKTWIDDFCNSIRTAMEGIDPNSREARILVDMQDEWTKLQEMWVNAFNDAAANRNGEYTTAEMKDAIEVAPAQDEVKASEAEAAPVVTEEKKAPEKPAAPKTKAPAASANKGTAYTNDQTPVNFHYALVNADELIASNTLNFEINQAYPQELQPRDRTRASSREQVIGMANELNPARLGESADVQSGAPIIGSDNVVESGNGRVMAIQYAMQRVPKSAQKYTKWLKANAEKFGLDPNSVTDGSVLVRVRDSDVQRTGFVKSANESVNAAYSESENAESDAEKLTPAMVEQLMPSENGSLDNTENRGFALQFMENVIPKNERGNYMQQNGEISQRGWERMKNAIFQRAYGSTALTQLMAEATGENVQNVTKALLQAAPRAVQTQEQVRKGQLYDIKLGEAITNAAKRYAQLKRDGVNLNTYLNQTYMPGFDMESAGEIALMKVMDKYARAPKKLAGMLRTIYSVLAEYGNPDQVNMLGVDMTPSIEEVVNRAAERFENNGEEAVDNGFLFSDRDLAIIAAEEERYNELTAGFTENPDTDNEEWYMEHIPEYQALEINKIVEDVASRAGYTEKAYHGTNAFGFTQFDMSKSQDQIFVAYDINVAKTYGVDIESRRIGTPFNSTTVSNLNDDAFMIKLRDAIDGTDTAHQYNYKIVTRDQAKQFMRETADDMINRIEQNAETAKTTDALQLMAMIGRAGRNGVPITSVQFKRMSDLIWNVVNIGNNLGKVSILLNGLYSINSANKALNNTKGNLVMETPTRRLEPILVYTKGDAADKISRDINGGGIYSLFTRPGKQLVIDAKGKNWNRIHPEWDPKGKGWKTREIAEYARSHGYDSVRINNVYDNGGMADNDLENGYGDIGIFFKESDVKSADPVTYDENGNIIPLHERFEVTNPDIRYSDRALTKAAQEEGFGPHTDMLQFSIRGVTEAAGLTYEVDENGTNRYILRDKYGNIVEPGSFTAEMVKDTPAGKLIDIGVDFAKDKVTAGTNANAQRQFIADIVNMIGLYQDAAMVWELSGSLAFSALKTNGDPQYSDSYDFGTICKKTQAILNVISETQVRLQRGLTKEEIDNIVYEEVGRGAKDKNGKWKNGETPCPVCYVYATWVNKPARIELARRFRDQYKNWTEQQINNLMNYEPKQQPGETKTSYNERVTDLNRRKLWISLCLADKTKGANGSVYWKRKANPELCPNEVLLDLRRTGEMATKYPKTWMFMQKGGNAMGKAIQDYADSRLGETIIGKAQGAGNLGKKLLQDEIRREDYGQGYIPKFVNPFLSGNEKMARRIFQKAVTNIKKQNLKGGQRWQSWSDFRAEWGSDYLMEMMTMQLLGSQVQTYTKVVEAIDLLASAGFEVNLSGMPYGDGFWHNEDGSIKIDENGRMMLRFSPVTGINPEAALEFVKKYGQQGNVQFMTVGISDDHIRTALASDYVTFVIPFHGSGGSVRRVQNLMKLLREQLQTGDDYTNAQTDTIIEKDAKGGNANPNWKLREAILEGKYDSLNTAQRAAIKNNEYLNRLYEERYVNKDSEAYGVFFKHAEAQQIYPYEYWDKNTTLATADVNSLRFIEYCQLLGVIPRFSGITKKDENDNDVEYANFSGARRDAAGNIIGYDPVPGYWKLLIDRSMYNRVYDDNGNLIPSQSTYHAPRVVSVNNIDIGAMPKDVNHTAGYSDDEVRQVTERVIQRIEAESAQNKAAGDPFNSSQDYADDEQQRTDPGDHIRYSLRTDPAPKKIIYGYKAFYARNGKLYPPMVSNITDEEQKVSKATSGTMKGLPTPVGVWLDADVGGIMVDEKGVPVRANTTGRLRVKNDKSGGDASLAFRPGWHLGEWPDAKQFNKMDPETGERGKLMPDDLVFALCEVSADNDYQLDALSYGINEKGGFSRSQAGLPWIPKDGYYKYRTNVDPTTAPWLIAGSIRVVEILNDEDCARICAQYGVKPDQRYSRKPINLADYGLKRGPVTPDTEGMERFQKNDASRANDELLNSALNDPEYADAYVQREINFSNAKQYEQLKKEFEMNGQNIEEYRQQYEERGYLGNLNNSVQYSDRDTNYKTDRQILAEALEGAAANAEERKMLQEYKDLAGTLDANEQLVKSLNERIRNLRLKNPNSDEEKRLVQERNQIQSTIDAADKRLYTMERMEPMRRIAKNERKKAENDLQRAREHMQRYREGIIKREYIGRIERTSRRLAKWLTAPAGKSSNYVPESLRRPLGEFLMTIDKISKQRREGGPMTEEDKKFANQLQQIEQMLRSIERARSVDTQTEIEQEYSGYLDLPKGFTSTMSELVTRVQQRMQEAGTKNLLDEMSTSELEALDMTLTAISSSITHINDFLSESFAGTVSEVSEKTIDEMREMRKRKDGMRGLQRAADFVLWDNVMPVYAFERMGEGGRKVFMALREGQDKLAFNAKRIIDIAEQMYTEEEAKAWMNEIVEFNDPNTNEHFRMTVAHLMSLYALSRRAQALGHILGEGIRVADFKEKNKTVTDKGHVIGEVMLKIMTDKLTDRQKAVADEMVRIMSTLGSEWGNYVSMRRFGYRQFTEDHYFPIKSDSDLLPAKTDTSTGNELYKLLNMSMTKPLTQKANNRIMLENIFDVFAGHMADMAQYNAMALPVLDAVKWLNFKNSEQAEGETAKYTDGVRDAIRDAFGTPAIKYLTEFLKDVNGGGNVNDTGVDLTQRMLSRYNRVAVAANLRVALLQPLAIIRAGNELPGTNLAKGTLKAIPRLKSEIKEMQEKSGIALWKSLGYREVNIGRSVMKQIQHVETLTDKISDKSMVLAELGDQVTWAAMWMASKEYIRKMQRDLVPGTDAFFEAVRKKFEDVIYNTQVVDSVLTKSQLMRSNKTTNRMMSSFMSEPTTTFNTLMRAWDRMRLEMLKGKSFQEAWQKHGAGMGKTALCFIIAAAVETAIAQIMSAYRDDDDYETFMDKVKDGFWQTLADNLNPLTLLPGIKQIYEAGVKPLLGMDTFDDQNVLTEGISTTVQGIQKILNGKGTVWGQAYTLAKGISMTSGIPLHPVMREFQALWNNTVVRIQPNWRLETSATQESVGYNLLYKAYESGDTARQGQLKQRLTERGADADKINNAMTSRIKSDLKSGEITEEEAAKRIQDLTGKDANAAYFKTQQMQNSDWSKYDNLENAIKTGSGYQEAVNELTSHGVELKDVQTKAKSIITEMAVKDKLSEAEIQKLLTQYGGMSADEAYIRSQELRYQQLTGTQTTSDAAMVFYAIDNKQSPKAAIDGLAKHGKEAKSIASSVSSKYKQQYLDLLSQGKKSEAAALKGRLITVFDYLGYDGAKKLEDWEKAK